MTDLLQAALTRIELRESELLAWGAVGAEWQRAELIEVLAEHGDAENMFAELVDRGMVVPTPSGGFRSRSAETARLLATLRQAFRGERILNGRPLVLDYRFLQRPRRRPKREILPDDFIASLGGAVQAPGRQAVRALIPPTTSAFQQRSTQQILKALNATDASGVVVTAGTGSGKTLAFYLPLLAWLADNVNPATPETVTLALYPRNELLKDQLQSLVKMSLTLAAARPNATPLSIATWFSPTPNSAFYITKGWTDWVERGGGYVCPFLRCPVCDVGDLVWLKAALARNDEYLECLECRSVVPGTTLRLTRDSARKWPADIMLSTTESVNRQLSSPSALRAFGIATRSLRAVLLDEIHTYEGTSGAQNALLLRRVRHALGHVPVWAGLSATLTDAGDFFARLVNLDPGQVQVIEPEHVELEESGAEYLVALRHDPNSGTGPLSASIQTAMALSRCLDALHSNPFDPAIDSGGLTGSRLFAFTDKLDSTNRLYWDLLDAEGWLWPGKPNGRLAPLTLAHLRSPSQERMKAGQQQDATERDADGQEWWLAEYLGHQINGDIQKRIGRTSSQDSGVASDAEIIVATASLEVGFDDNRVGAVLQHKAPHDVAQFLQRKGRAGRDATTRPWTVIVLSNWGRDRDAWDAYDALFSPVVPSRSLPIENLYVLRIQAVYSLLDWLAQKLGYQDNNNSWADAAGPAELLGNSAQTRAGFEARQAKMAALLGKLLRDGNERESLRRHLRRSLALGRDARADQVLEQILWESPRPLLTAVVPTLRRRLLDQWAGERPAQDDSGLRSRTPLRDFVPGNLFDELMVPDVEFQVPWKRNEVRSEQLPALRAIREFLPGSVSRHFGVNASNKRHWVPLPDAVDEYGSRWVDVYSYGGLPLERAVVDDVEVPVFAPTSVTLSPVPLEVADASDMRAEWNFQATPLGRGAQVALPTAVRALISQLTAHLHVQGGGVRLLRYTCTGSGSLRANGVTAPERIRFGLHDSGTWVPAALGVEIHCDVLIGRTAPPVFVDPPGPDERSAWLRHLVLTSPAMPKSVSSFGRTNLAEVLLTVAATWPEVRDNVGRAEFANALRAAAGLLGMLNDDGNDKMTALLADTEIVEVLRQAVIVAGAPDRSADWLTWLRRRHTLSAANVLLASLTSWGTAVDVDELTVDLDPLDDGTFYISEQSPGGTGQIEALTRTMAKNPDRLGMSLQDALRPSDMELLDSELRGFLAIADHPGVAAAMQTLAAAWRSGHSEVHLATTALEGALRAVGIEMGHAARTALTTRLAGPGAHPGLVAEVARWIQRRDKAVATNGFAVDPRSLATLLADRTEVDAYLKLTGPSPAERVRAISNVLWPWGERTRSAGTYNPYAPILEPVLDVVRDHWSTPVQVIEFRAWDDEVRRQVHDELLRGREAILRVPVVARQALRSAILDLNTVPIEVGPLMCYPQVTGVAERGKHAEARVLLRESW